MKCKHPLVKRLRKAGMSTKEAVRVASAASNNYRLQRPDESLINLNYNPLGFGGMFYFDTTPEGHDYWQAIDDMKMI